MCWLQALNRIRGGSLPRCLRLLEGNRRTVAARLQTLIGKAAEVQIAESDFWMPLGPPAQSPNAPGYPDPRAETRRKTTAS